MESYPNYRLLVNGSIVMPENVLENGYIRIQDGKIKEIGSMAENPDYASEELVFDCKGKMIIPGMIDIHVHGAGGSDFMDATADSFECIAGALAREGTTAYLATTMTNPVERIEEALHCAGNYIKNGYRQGLPEMLGIHLEGPFINAAQKGAQPETSILSPDAALFMDWQKLSKNTIKIVTFAPETDADFSLLQELRQTGVIASIGHSDATFAEAQKAISEGVSHATHLFNGMRGLHHREPGVVGATLLNENVYVEVIPDGNHFHPDLLKMVVALKGIERILIITDGIRAKGLPDGKYDLGGNDVIVKDGRCMLAEGNSLAGSIIPMNEARMNVAKWTGLSIVDQVQMTSVNQAKRLGFFDRKGSIELGKDADIVILGMDGEVDVTICKGIVAYKR